MSIKIIKPGIFTSIQDLGRRGYRNSGIGPGGAMDPFACRMANYLVGNDDHLAVIEMRFPAPEILFLQDAVVAITGADLTASINDDPLPAWKPQLIKKDSVLSFKAPVNGSWAYLSVAGGWKLDPWLGSYSTHLMAKAGGYMGRTLQKDDQVNCGENNLNPDNIRNANGRLSEKEILKVYQPANTIRCMPSVEWHLMNKLSMDLFESAGFLMTTKSDRMGYRFTGESLLLNEPKELISSAVDRGTIQLLPDGNIVVLMADHQTTGGYARIASVIKADLPKLAQLRPGEQVRFTLVSRDEAENSLLAMERSLKEIKAGCQLMIENFSRS